MLENDEDFDIWLAATKIIVIEEYNLGLVVKSISIYSSLNLAFTKAYSTLELRNDKQQKWQYQTNFKNASKHLCNYNGTT